MAEDSKTYVFGGESQVPAWLAYNNGSNGFLGGNGLAGGALGFLLGLVFGNGWGGFGGFGNGGFGGAAASLGAQADRNNNTDLIMNAINGTDADVRQLATMANTDFDSMKNAIATLGTSLATLSGTLGISSLQIVNAIQSGDASLSRQLCECCCENRLAISEQTNALSAQAAANHASTTLQSAQNHADDRLDVCQQTNELKTQSIQNTQSIKDAIAAQSIMINDKFCDLEKRELQNKITVQGDLITQLRGEISNDKQTEKFNSAFAVLNDKLNQVAAKQPNTVPVTWPNLVAVNNTPNTGWYNGFNSWGYNFPGGSYWG